MPLVPRKTPSGKIHIGHKSGSFIWCEYKASHGIAFALAFAFGWQYRIYFSGHFQTKIYIPDNTKGNYEIRDMFSRFPDPLKWDSLGSIQSHEKNKKILGP